MLFEKKYRSLPLHPNWDHGKERGEVSSLLCHYLDPV